MPDIGTRSWWALGGVSLAVLAVGLDSTVLSVALPTLSTALHASAANFLTLLFLPRTDAPKAAVQAAGDKKAAAVPSPHQVLCGSSARWGPLALLRPGQ
jgi:hypothetical protein